METSKFIPREAVTQAAFRRQMREVSEIFGDPNQRVRAQGIAARVMRTSWEAARLPEPIIHKLEAEVFDPTRPKEDLERVIVSASEIVGGKGASPEVLFDATALQAFNVRFGQSDNTR